MRERRTAVIVGGTGNVGRECLRTFTDAGFRTLSLSRHAPQHEGADNELWRCCDVTDETAFRAVLAEVLGPPVDMTALIYTPALPPDVEVGLAEYPMEAWQQTLAVYVTGFLVAFQEGLRLMKAGGHIVALGSAVTRFEEQHLPPFFAGHYSAAKAALNELCKWGRREAHQRGLLLSRVAPGALDVPYHREAPLNRRPKATLPVPNLVREIVTAVSDARELDVEMVTST